MCFSDELSGSAFSRTYWILLFVVLITATVLSHVYRAMTTHLDDYLVPGASIRTSIVPPVRPLPSTANSNSPWLHGGEGCYRLDNFISVFVTPHPTTSLVDTAKDYEVSTYDVLVTHAPNWTPISVAPAYDGRDRTGPSRLLRQSWQVVFRTPTGALRSYEVSPWDHLSESGVELRCAPVGCTAPFLEVAP